MENNDKTKKVKTEKQTKSNMSRSKKVVAMLELFLLLLIIIGIPALIYLCNPEIVENFKSVEKFNDWISEYTGIGIIIYIICQIAQIVISVLPGQVIQIAGGYIFGFFLTFIASIIGAFLGTLATFYLAKLLGKNAIQMICGEERFHRYQRLMSTQKARKIIFLLYLIPGLPKDVVAYAAGVSDMNGLEFTIISLLGRTPAMTLSILFGVMIYSDSYIGAIILAAIVLVLFGLCMINRKALTDFIEKSCHDLSEKHNRTKTQIIETRERRKDRRNM